MPIPRRVLLIDGGGDGIAELSEAGKFLGVAGIQVFEARAIGGVEALLGGADNFPQLAKEEDTQKHTPF